jgi:hypothetical protein
MHACWSNSHSFVSRATLTEESLSALPLLLLLLLLNRILECEKQAGIAGGRVNVELWDVSGSMQ